MGFAEAKLVSYARFGFSLNFQFVFGVSLHFGECHPLFTYLHAPPLSQLSILLALFLPPPEKFKRTHPVFPRNFPRTHDAAIVFSPDW